MGRGAARAPCPVIALTQRLVRIHPDALEEAEAATDWYLARSHRAAISFLDEFDRLVERIAGSPENFPAFDFGTRRAQLRRFPYFLVFRERDGAIELIALAHGKRRPGYWRTRV